MKKNEYYAEKLAEMRKNKKLTQEQLGQLVGVSKQSVYAREKGKILIDLHYLKGCAKVLDFSVDAFLQTQIANPSTQDAINIPVYDIEVAAGSGISLDSVSPDWNATISSRILENIPTGKNRLAIIFARGDSMEPVIKDGAMLMVKREHSIKVDGVYVFTYLGDTHVKRLQFHGGSIRVISDNSNYNPYDITTDDCHIYGRVVWVGQKMY